MQLTPVGLLTERCNALVARLEALDATLPRPTEPRPLFAAPWVASDLQRLYAVEWILERLGHATELVQAEVADAVLDLVDTVCLAHGGRL